MQTNLDLIAVKAKQNKRLKFTSQVHLINEENLARCYSELKRNKACGVDGMTVEEYGENLGKRLNSLIERMKSKRYQPQPVKQMYIPKAGNKEKRGLGIPTVEDKLVQIMLKKILEGIYEADFLECSYGLRPNRSCHQAVKALNKAVMRQPVNCVVEVDIRKWNWLADGVYKRLCEELAKLEVTPNHEKTRHIDLMKDETFSFLGFVFRRTKTRQRKRGITKTPKMEARTKLLRKLKKEFCRHRSQPIDRVIYLINPILRGWMNYYRIENSARCFGYVKDWVEKKARRHLMKARRREGFGWERWSKQWLYQTLGLYSDYKVRYYQKLKVSPA